MSATWDNEYPVRIGDKTLILHTLKGMFWRKYNIHVGSPYLVSFEFIWLSYSIWATFCHQNIILVWVCMGVYL